MAEKIRWGILSTAGIGKNRVIPAIHKARNGEVVAVASRTQERAEAFAAETKIPRAFGSYEALIESGEVDAIYIPVPNSEHAEWSIRCAEAGIPTLCEKPLARNAAEAHHMVEVFAERGVLFAEAFMYRFHPQHWRVKELIAEGAIGQLQVISSAFTFTIRSEENIRLQANLAGGALMDVGCYCVNAMRFLTEEEPEAAQAFARFGENSGVDEVITGILRFPSGVLGHFDAGLRTYRNHTYEVRGSEGCIQLEESFTPYAQNTIIRVWRGEDYREIVVPDADQYQLMVEDFGDALLQGRPPKFAPQDAVRNMRALDWLIASARANVKR